MGRQYANINETLLVWARKTVKLSTELAAKKIGVKEEKLLDWEAGESKPTIKQLYKIADIYRRPFALFYFPKPPKHFKALKDFRKFAVDYVLSDDQEYQLHKEILLFQNKRQQALELYNLLDIEIPKFKLTGKLSEPPAQLAKRIIQELKINHREIANTAPGYDALNYWKAFLEAKGVLVFQTTGVPLEVMRGACIAKTKLPVIIINSNDTQNGRVFSLLHELVHIILREDGISNFRHSKKILYDQVEIFCNQVAAEILVPNELLNSHITVSRHAKENMDWSSTELKSLSQYFCVSQEVIFRRLLTLGFTDKKSYRKFRKSFDGDKKKKRAGGGNYYRNVIAKNGIHFLQLALQGYYQEKLTASSLFDYTSVKLSNLPNLENMLYAKLQY